MAWRVDSGGAMRPLIGDDPLFPLPTNEAQRLVFDRLKRDTAVVVQGPPGTGKTHTIANLVASVSDQCDASVDINDVVISQVTSDETENGNGDGNTNNDIVITPDCKSVQLRRERQGGGNGRVYTITLKVKDSSGNVTTAVRQIYVASGSGPVIDSGVHYTVNGCTP